MKSNRVIDLVIAFLLCAASCSPGDTAYSRGSNTIRAEDMKFHLRFLGAPEFRGRNTPSAELDIASKYIALTAERIGLKPLMPGGSYYQEVPVEVTTVAPQASRMRLIAGARERVFRFPDGRDSRPGLRGRESRRERSCSSATGSALPSSNWDDYGGMRPQRQDRGHPGRGRSPMTTS